MAISAGVLAGLSGCGVWQSLSVRDNGSPSVAVRAALRPAAWARSSEHPGPGFEIGYERYRAQEARTLGAGESISLSGQTVLGPDVMGQTATVRTAQVVYTHPFYPAEHFELEPFVGVANVKLRLRAEPASTTQRPELNAARTAVVGGITPRGRINEWLALEARFSFIPLVASNVYGRSIELAAVVTPVPSVVLRVGHSQRRIGIDFDTSASWTQLDVRARGPFANLQFEF
jgi:hypothetical protein